MPHDIRPAPDVPAAREALERRYGHPPDFAAPGWNPVIDTLLRHRSIRRFLPDPLADGTAEFLVAAAQSAPSSSNLQVWSVVEIRDAAARDKLAAWAGNQRHVVEAPLFFVFLADLARADRVASRAGAEARTLDLTESLVVAIVDAALAAQNALVAAESLGLGTVYIGALRNRIEDVAELLGLPPRVVPLFGLAIGRPDPAAAADVKPRLPQHLVLHRDRYTAPRDEATAVADYDRRLAQFQASQNLPQLGWSEVTTRRVSEIAALNGRETLKASLAKFAFPLI